MNDYFEKYKDLKSEINNVCNDIKKNNYLSLYDNLNNLKQNLDNIEFERWPDKVGEVFKKNIEIAKNSLSFIIKSFEDKFNISLNLYEKLNNKLDELSNICNQAKSGLINVSEEEYNTKCLDLINEIESYLTELDNINNSSIKVKELENTNINYNMDDTTQNSSVIEGVKITADSDISVIQLANMCMAEQGSPEGAKFELSLLINQYKSAYGHEPSTSSELSYFMQTYGYGGNYWYAKRTRDMSYLETADQVYINAINDVLNGNRVLPSNVVEHDCFSDIAKIVVNGEIISDYDGIRNHANYLRDNTIIYNKMGSVYTFYEFAPNGGDPFGYF